jgi:hypothetical protein
LNNLAKTTKTKKKKKKKKRKKKEENKDKNGMGRSVTTGSTGGTKTLQP